MMGSGGRLGSIAVPPDHRFGYREIADDLASRIESGEYPPGEQLPSYAELGRMYSVSLSTAQAAIRQLRTTGLIRSEAGVGVFVAENGPAT